MLLCLHVLQPHVENMFGSLLTILLVTGAAPHELNAEEMIHNIGGDSPTMSDEEHCRPHLPTPCPPIGS